jgi:hypothetical protein
MPSYRYSLAFTAYASASRALSHTPSYTGPTFDLLSSVFSLMLDEDVWSYWSQPGDCAPFFLSPYCEGHGASMCGLDELWHGEDATRCPDPVYFGNIMYSGHLAHVGALVRLFAPDPVAADEVLEFDFGGATYTLSSLLERLTAQAVSSRDAFGGGITCEPGNVYPSCQSHLQAALRLWDALDGAVDDEHDEVRRNWQEYLFKGEPSNSPRYAPASTHVTMKHLPLASHPPPPLPRQPGSRLGHPFSLHSFGRAFV